MDREQVVIRHRNTGKITKVIKELDLFPKVEDTYKKQTGVGATFSIVCFIIVIYLIYTETMYYLDSNFEFKFTPDTDFEDKLRINVDLTIAMPCDSIGADIVDTTNQMAFRFGQLEHEDVWWELDDRQKLFFSNKQHMNTYLREEYHAVKDLLWKRSFTMTYDMPARKYPLDKPYDACRVHGSLELNKVAGNFHITAGKSLSLPRGHIHLSPFMSESDYNFTHRIDKLNFGDPSPGIIHPLEGDEQIADHSMILYQYFIDVVPTTVHTFMKTINTYQYSVKELSRPIDHNKGSHGMPGIYFKYDTSALRVIVMQKRDNIMVFITKLCAVVAGIYVCAGLINNLVQFIVNIVFCRFYSQPEEKPKAEIRQANLVFSNMNDIPDVIPLVR